MEEVESRKEVFESNIETKDEKAGSKKSYSDMVIHRSKKQHNIRKESIRVHPMISYDVHQNLYVSNDNANSWSHCEPSGIWCIVTTQVQMLAWPYDIYTYPVFIKTNVMYDNNNRTIRQCNRRRKKYQPGKGCLLFLNNPTIKEVSIPLLPPLYCSLPTSEQGWFPGRTRIRV